MAVRSAVSKLVRHFTEPTIPQLEAVLNYRAGPRNLCSAMFRPSVGENRLLDVRINRVAHIAIAAEDMSASQRALAEVFGLTPASEETNAEFDVSVTMYAIGETQLELLSGPASTPFVGEWLARGDGLCHICLEVDNLSAALTELKHKGVRVLSEKPRVGHGGTRFAFIDPSATANVLFELVEM